MLMLGHASSHAQSSCRNIAEMAFDVASIRDAGVPLNSVISRLSSDINDKSEQALAITVAHLVYSTKAPPEALKRETMKKCASQKNFKAK